MFARVKKSGKYEYLQIVENKKIKGKVRQRVIATVGRLDKLHSKGQVETLIRSLSRFSEKVLLILSGRSEALANAKKIGPSLIFERLWNELGIKKAIKKMLSGRKFQFDVERAIFLTTLHRLIVSGSDCSCDKWKRDYVIRGTEGIELHHLYRAMSFLGEPIGDQEDNLPFTQRCIKDQIEEYLFKINKDIFSDLELVFFDTTSIYFEGKGGSELGKHGHSKDHRPDLKQMVIGVVIDNHGRPICCEMWPGNTSDAKTLIPIVERLKDRFGIKRFCIVADRGMFSASIIKELNDKKLFYILGTRMRSQKVIKDDILSRGGRFKEVYPENTDSKSPSPLRVKEVWQDGKRYIVCLNPKQARKDALTRKTIIDTLKEKLGRNPKAVIGNKGYRRYLKVSKDTVSIDISKIKEEEKFDGKWVLETNTDLSSQEVALRYKELWKVEHVFRDMKSVLETRPIYHQREDAIKGHVFCSFLALLLRKELLDRLERQGHDLEWCDIIQDLEALQEVVIQENGKTLAIRTQCQGTCSKIFKSLKMALPPTIREITE